jgi:cell division protein FtsZ
MIASPGFINVDFADMKSVLHDAGTALMGVGYASGEGRAEKAALQAINSPLLEISINGAKGVLFAISSNDDLTMAEFQEAAKVITESIDKDARVIIGTIIDDRIKKGEMKITVIATGFPTDSGKKTSLFNSQQQSLMSSAPIQREPVRTEPSQASTPLIQKSEPMPLITKTPSPVETEGLEVSDDDSEWGVLPPFMRRGKK